VRISFSKRRRGQNNFGEESGTSSVVQYGSLHISNALNAPEGKFTYFNSRKRKKTRGVYTEFPIDNLKKK
jgi:hypothetical protein